MPQIRQIAQDAIWGLIIMQFLFSFIAWDFFWFLPATEEGVANGVTRFTYLGISGCVGAMIYGIRNKLL